MFVTMQKETYCACQCLVSSDGSEVCAVRLWQHEILIKVLCRLSKKKIY